MSTAIIYYSKHRGNTKKLLDAIATAEEVTLIDVTADDTSDLTSFDRIGFVSGIYFSSVARQILSFADAHLPKNKDVFYIYTHGARKASGRLQIRSTVGYCCAANRCAEALELYAYGEAIRDHKSNS